MNPQVIARKQREIIIELSRRESSNSLSEYTMASWPLIEPRLPFIPGWHIDAICEHLEAVIAGEILKLIINIPPRHAKSTLVSVALPSWTWTRFPEKKFIYGSHSYSLSKRDSVKTRNVIQSSWYRDTFNIRWDLADDQNEKTNFLNTAGGSRRATSVMASIIGEGGDVLVLDDPHSPRSVRSEVKREDQIEWIDTEFFTRVNDPKTVAKIVIMQRLDEKDATAHLLAQGGWEHLMLPAEYDPARRCVTCLGWEDPRTKEGQPLWPERFDTPDLERVLKLPMGSKAWAGQGQQRPAPQEGNIVKRAWWKFYREAPGDLDKVGIAGDLTFKDTEKSDFVALLTWGRRGANKYLLDIDHEQMDFNEQLRRFARMCSKWPNATAKWIEDAANGAALVAMVKKTIPGVIPVSPQGSKIARAEAIAPQIEAGNIYLPDPTYQPHIDSGLAQKVLDFIEEWAVFPNGANDDRVDASSLGISQLTEAVSYDWEPVSLTGPSKWLGR